MVAAPTHPAERVALNTYPSRAALYSQSPICDAALAPISARAPGTASTSRYARTIRSPIPRGCGFLRTGRRHHRGPDPRCCVGKIDGAIQQRLAAQAADDVAGLIDGCLGRVGIARVHVVLGVVDQ